MMTTWNMMDGWAGAGWFWMLVSMLVVTVVVLIGVWLIVRSPRGGRSPSATALDILSERYARGEVTKDEFEVAKRALAG